MPLAPSGPCHLGLSVPRGALGTCCGGPGATAGRSRSAPGSGWQLWGDAVVAEGPGTGGGPGDDGDDLPESWQMVPGIIDPHNWESYLQAFKVHQIPSFHDIVFGGGKFGADANGVHNGLFLKREW